MVSRKRSEGKARKAAKAEAEAEAEKQSALSSAETREERESLNSRILRLQMENEDVKNGGSRNNLTTAEKCNHGYVPFTKGDVCMEMIVAFLRAHRAAYKCGQNGFAAATTVTFEKYPEVIKDSAKMNLIITHFVAMGTECLLAGNYDDARQIASFARYFEYVNVEYSHCHGRNEGNTANWQNMFEMISADEHTLVKYLRKRIRCHCLEEKYKQVKSITKMGTCMNSRCSLPGRRVERSKMKYCTQCCLANYCSRECQVADWPRHKENCDSYSTCQSSCKAEFTVIEAFDVIRSELNDHTGVVATLSNLIDNGSSEDTSQYAKKADKNFRKAKMGKARKLITDEEIQGDAELICNAVTFDLIEIFRASKPGKENKEEQLKYLRELKKDIERFLELESKIIS